MKIRILLIITMIFSVGFAGINATNRALLVGIGNYNTNATGWAEIHGNNDADLLKKKLSAKGFTVNVLKDKQATKKNIKTALSNMVASTKSGDVVYIHFSGHGQLVEDVSGDEIDGFDQSFVCYDACSTPRYTVGGKAYNGQNHFIDDELFPFFSQLKSKVGSKGRVIVAFDSCYSGGADRGVTTDEAEEDSDVEFSETVRGAKDEFMAEGASKTYLRSIKGPGQYSSSGGELIVISACQRDRKNYECTEKHSGKNYGSLTYCIGKMLDNNIPMSQWADFFTTKKYKSYKTFRDSQRPVVEKH